MKIYFTLLVFIFSLSKCDTVSKNKNKIIESKWNMLFNKYQKLNSSFAKNEYSMFSINYYIDGSIDSLKLSSAFNGSKTVILRFPLFDITGEFQNYAEIYFDEDGRPFAMSQKTEESITEITLFDIKNGSFYRDTLTGNENIQIDEKKSFSDADYQCEIVKNVDNLIHRFSSLGKYTPTECINEKEDIITLIDSVPLYKERSGENSQIIKYLERGSRLKYVLADSVTVEYMNENTYLLKVKAINSQDSGWVYYLYENFMDVNELDN